MRLHQLTSLEVNKINHERQELIIAIEKLKRILGDQREIFNIIKAELNQISQSYSNERRTDIDYQAGDLNIEDLIHNESVVVTLSKMGYIKKNLFGYL